MKRGDSRALKGGRHIRKLLLPGLFGWAVLVACLWVGALLLAPMDPDYTAGELYDHTLAWQEGGALYQEVSEPPYRVLNYPPLFLLAVRGLTAAGVATLPAGRMVSLLGLLAVACILSWWLRDLGCEMAEAWAVVAILAASFPVMYGAGQFRLELPAAALTLGALFVIRQRADLRRTVVAGALAGLACFVKQTQVVFVVIAALWLLRHRRRQGAGFLVGAGSIAAGGAVMLQWSFGSEVWRHLITYTVGTYSLGQLSIQAASFVLPWCVFVGLAVYAGRDAARRRDLRWWYWVGSSAWLLAAVRVGSGSQYFIDWSIATLLWVGPAIVAWFRNDEPVRPTRRLVRLLVVGQIVGAGVGVTAALAYNVQTMRATSAALPRLCAALPAGERLVVTEFPGMARACGREPAIHPFIMTNLAGRGLWEERQFLEQLRSGAFSVLVTRFNPNVPLGGAAVDRATPAMLDVLRTDFTVEGHVAGWYVLRRGRGSRE